MKRSPLKSRSKPLKRHAPKRKPGMDDPAYRKWLKQWPCIVSLMLWCRKMETPMNIGLRHSGRLDALLSLICGPAQVAHVGLRGLAQRCSDREAIPLCAKHHLHPTAGGGPESHHALGKNFWAHHGIDRKEVIETLNRLYHEETGR